MLTLLTKRQKTKVDIADLVALDMPALSRNHHVGELLLPKQPAEHSQQVVLVVVPLEAVLLPRGRHSTSVSPHRLNHLPASQVTTEGGPERPGPNLKKWRLENREETAKCQPECHGNVPVISHTNTIYFHQPAFFETVEPAVGA